MNRIGARHNPPTLLWSALAVAALTTLSAGTAAAESWAHSQADRPLPPGIYFGGREAARDLGICRGRYNDGLHPGKLLPDTRECNIGWGGKEVTLREYDVLVDVVGARWEHFRGEIPPGAVRGGGEHDRPLFVCRARFHEGVHPGKVVDGKCNIGWGGNEIAQPDFEILSIQPRPQWSPVAGALPPGAFVGGREQERELFVCRARFHEGVHPGKVVDGNCNIGWGGKEQALHDFEVLTNVHEHRWVPAEGGLLPEHAFEGGYERERKLFVCRAEYNGGVHPGKVVDGKCNIGWGGNEVARDRFEVLVVP